MIAIGSKGQLPDLFFVPLERRHLLVRRDIPNHNSPIAGAGGESAAVRGKRKTVIGARSRTELESILVASPDIPKANGCLCFATVCFGGEKRLSIGQQRQPFHPPGMSRKCGGFAWSVEWPELDGAFPEASHERLGIG